MNKNFKKENVVFLKERTFGDIIGAPFYFIIQEFKPFAGAILKYAAPFLAISFVTISLVAKDFYFFSDPASSPSFSISFFVFIISFALGLLSVIVVTHSYISLYQTKGKGNFTTEDVGILLKNNIFKIMGAGLLVMLIVAVGFIFFYIPGIYLSVALSFVFIIIIYEKKSATYAISRSFEVIKGKWWQTFGLTLVFGFIIGAMSYVFIIPIYVVVIIAAIKGSDISAGSAIFIALFVFLYFSAYLFFVSMQQIMLAFQYFNILSEKEGLHLKDKISAIYDTENLNEEDNDEINIEKRDEKEKPEEKNRFLNDDDDLNRFKPKK